MCVLKTYPYIASANISIALNYLLLKVNLRFKSQHAVCIFYESRNFKGITACNCLNINMRCYITAFYRIMTVKHDCDKSSCRTFLSHRVFIIIYIFKSNVWRLYDIQVRREKALGDDSYSTRSTLMTHTDRSSCAALSQTHLSGLQRKHHVGTLLCCQVRSLPRVVFVSAGLL